MRNSNTKSKRNLAIPGEPMPKEEFIALIKEAEKGPFYSYDELILKFNSWKKSLKK